MMYEQLSIFDFIIEDKLPKLEEIIKLITEKFGLTFSVGEYRGNAEYVHVFDKKKRTKLEIHDSKYSIGEQKRFVSVNYSKMTGDCGGFGCPCDDMDEVYDCVRKAIEYDGKNNKHRKP